MGFLDTILGDRKRCAEIRYSELDGWVEGRINLRNREKLNEASPILKSIGNIVSGLRRDVGRLESEKLPAGVDERFHKIVKTNKPAYIRSMMRVIDCIESADRDVKDLGAYDSALKENINLIGKINFGDGRYLGFVHQDVMREIHSKSKRLLDEHERLSSLLKADSETEDFMRLRVEYKRVAEAERDLGNARMALAESESKLKAEEAELERYMGEYELAVKECGMPENDEIGRGLDGALSEKRAAEHLIHSGISRMERGLRKFGRYSMADSHLVGGLLENPVEGFLRSDPAEFAGMLDRLRVAVADGKIELKEADKMLSRIDGALRELSVDLRMRHAKALSAVEGLRARIDGCTAFRQERRLKLVVSDREKAVEGLRHGIANSRVKLGRMESDIELAKSGIQDGMERRQVKVIFQ